MAATGQYGTIRDENEAWRLARVLRFTGLSRTELYRQMADGRFPQNRRYPGMKKAVYWDAEEVRAWKSGVRKTGLRAEIEALFG